MADERLGRAVLELDADGENLDRKVEDARRSASEAIKSTGESLKKTGGQLTRNVTAPILGLGTAVIMTGARFDDQMARVQAISGATGDGFDQLRSQAKELGSTTRFSASEAASGMEFLALAGFEVNEITAAMPALLDLASASAMDLASASDIVSDTMSAFGMSADRAGEAADIFAQTSSMANTDVLQLGEAMKMAAPAADAAGLSLGETSAVLGVLADSGIKGSMAGTTVNAMLRDLVSNAEDGAVAIGETSVAVFDAEGNFRDFGDIMRDVDDATHGLSDAQREQALRNVFQAQSIRGVNLMLGEGIDTYDDYVRANDESAGAASAMAEVMEDTAGGGFRELRSMVEGLMIDMSDELAPIIKDTVIPLVQQLGGRIGELISWFSNLDDRHKQWILAAIGIVAALGPLLMVVGMVVSAIGTLIPVIAALASPVGLVIAAIAGLVAAFIWAWNNSETFREIVTAVFEAVQEFIAKAIAKARKIIETVLAAIQKFWAKWGDNILAFVVGTFKNIRTVIDGVMQVIRGIIDVVMGLIRGDWRRVWDGIKSIVSGVLTVIRGIVDQALNFIRNLFPIARDVITRVWRALWDRIRSTVSTAISNLKRSITDGLNNAVQWFRELPGRILSAIGDVSKLLFDVGKRIIRGLIDGIKNMFGSVKDTLGDLTGKLTSWKGPESTDRVLLRPAAVAIMGGFADDLEAQAGSRVQAALGRVTAGIDVAASTTSRGVRGDAAGITRAILSVDGRELAEAIGPQLVEVLRIRNGTPA